MKPIEAHQHLPALLDAVRKAATLCERVSDDFRQTDSQSKEDASPVTVADYGSQALINRALSRLTPDAGMVSEEDGDALRAEPELAERIASFTLPIDAGLTADELANAMDWGESDGGATGSFWTLDPIDGTKGYLRGDQYAIALALITDGTPVFGIMACPRLAHPDGTTGCLFVGGTDLPAACYSLTNETAPQPVEVFEAADRANAKMCESVESKHSAHDRSQRLRELLGISPDVVRLDSQAKYAVVARGDAAMYVRLPVKKGYQEKIWDHAAGVAVIEAAGGTVTDLDGKRLNFGLGACLAENRGVLATNTALHADGLDAVAETTPPLNGR